MKKNSILVCCCLISLCLTAQKVIPLYKGAAPGSEAWNWDEERFFVKVPMNNYVVYNVSKPTLTVFQPVSANGTSILICPGGGMRVINFETEGRRVAEQLNKKGITVFVLKYRVIKSETNDPWQETLDGLKDTSATKPKKNAEIGPIALADGKEGFNYIKEHAKEYKLDPAKIGIIGFSAGAGMTIKMATDSVTKPAFIASIYGVTLPDKKIDSAVPPIFIAAASDDQFGAPPKRSVELYKVWSEVNKNSELHIYSKGGHGLRLGNSPSWIDRFTEWLTVNGF